MTNHKDTPITIDSWQIFPNLRYSDVTKRDSHFDILDDCVVLLDQPRRNLSEAGRLSFSIRWPAEPPDPNFGILELEHPSWNELLYRIVCVHVPTILPDDYDWRFLCPIRRTWEQMLYLEPDGMPFVSRRALGRSQRRSNLNRISQILSKIYKFQDTYDKLNEKPRDISDQNFILLKSYDYILREQLISAANSVPDINQIRKAFIKQWSF
jgi:hypothetical protein